MPSNPRAFLNLAEKKVPGGTRANVVVAIAVPVVDIQAVLVEVADTRDVASVDQRKRMMSISIYVTENRTLLPEGLYALFSVFYLGAVAIDDISARDRQEV